MLIAPAVRGLGTVVIGEIMRLGFAKIRLDRLGLNVFDGNTAAIACYERADFVKEGHLRDVARASSGDWSVFVLGMLASDPRPEPSATERGNQRE